MLPLKVAPSLTDQVYDAILDEICSGALAPGAHLVQEQLAERLGVSRQPIQQAMALLKADGLVEEIGKRGLSVAPLDVTGMRHHYDIRAALDGLAARRAADRVGRTREVARELISLGATTAAAAEAAIDASDVAELIRLDIAFHTMIYEASGNPVLAKAAEPHWRYLRRAMGDVMRLAEPPRALWQQHADLLDAVVEGDAERAEQLALDHVAQAARMLTDAHIGREPVATTGDDELPEFDRRTIKSRPRAREITR